MNHSVENRGTAWIGQPSSANAASPIAATPAAVEAPVPVTTDEAVLTSDTTPASAPVVPLVAEPPADGGDIRLTALSGTDKERLDQFRDQLGRHLGVAASSIVLKVDAGQVLVRVLPPTALGQSMANFTDTLRSPWRPVEPDAADQAWVKHVLQGSSSNRLDRLRVPEATAPVAPAKNDGKTTPGLIVIAPITASAQTQQFIVDAMKREITAIADPLLQRSESIEIRYTEQQTLQARNRFSGATFEVRLPDDSYRDMRFQLLRQNPTPSLATLGGTRLLTEIHAGGQVLTGDGADGSTFLEAAKVTYTTAKNWTYGVGVLASQQLDGDPRQGLSVRIGHNYWGVANVMLTPDGQFHFRNLDTQAPREAWNWFLNGSTLRKVAVGGSVLAGAAYAVVRLGKSEKEMVFSNPLPELQLGKSKFRVIGGVLGKVSLGGSEDGRFTLGGKLTGGTLRFRENGTGGVVNEQGVRYRRERLDDETLTETLQGEFRGTNKLSNGYIHHNLVVAYDLQAKSLGESFASTQVVMPFGDSRHLSWNAGGGIGLNAKHKVSFGDLRAGMMWQPSPAISVFGSAGYVKGRHLIDPNLAGGLIGSMMPPAKRGEVQAPNQQLNTTTGPDRGRMAFTIGSYIRL